MPRRCGNEAKTQVELKRGLLVLEIRRLKSRTRRQSAVVYRHWSGKQGAVVEGINLITLLCTNGVRVVPVD